MVVLINKFIRLPPNIVMSTSRIPVLSEQAPKPYSFLSQAIISGSQIFCSGQIGYSPDTNILVEGTIKDRTVSATQ